MAERPAIETRYWFIKLFQSVAPLAGLLGTVTGMIVTFQMITLYGTGDPKLMAGGISQALVTTVLGLLVAIPTTYLHSFTHHLLEELLVFLRNKVLVFLLKELRSR
jgi:biopolymer transport protein ExbB